MLRALLQLFVTSDVPLECQFAERARRLRQIRMQSERERYEEIAIRRLVKNVYEYRDLEKLWRL